MNRAEKKPEPAEYTELLLGCGNNRRKTLYNVSGEGLLIEKDWKCLTTLDMDPSTKPDVVHDLNDLPLPFDDESFDEVHAYDVLEHVGMQGDFETFFEEFAEYWRILKPGGVMCGTTPAWDSIWAWGDPGHTRVLSEATLVYLNQREYKLQIGKTAMTDYRPWWSLNLELVATKYEDEGFAFVLQKP